VRVPPTKHRTADGRPFTIRCAARADAGKLLDHSRTLISAEPERHVTEREEFDWTVEAVTRFYEAAAAHEGSLGLVALEGDEIIGEASLRGSRRAKLRHVSELGVGVRADRRRCGVARALLGVLLDAARAAHGLRKVTLRVFADNAPAIALYESFGFVIEGRRKGQVRIGDEYVDDLLMALDVSHPSQP